MRKNKIVTVKFFLVFIVITLSCPHEVEPLFIRWDAQLYKSILTNGMLEHEHNNEEFMKDYFLRDGYVILYGMNEILYKVVIVQDPLGTNDWLFDVNFHTTATWDRHDYSFEFWDENYTNRFFNDLFFKERFLPGSMQQSFPLPFHRLLK